MADEAPRTEPAEPETTRSDYTPGSIPKNFMACCKGYLTRDPRRIVNRNGYMTVCRMGINMASSRCTVEEANELTEWLDLIAFREMGERLARMHKGELIIATGAVTKHFYQSRHHETKIGRSMVIESLLGAGAALVKPGSEVEALDPNKLDEIVDSGEPVDESAAG